ncbi:MAG TPA: hypothetical protein VFZ65_20100 [Planctomycetota bacterium]|nr:hypothetical protein [Planctomycetota bacterium]
MASHLAAVDDPARGRRLGEAHGRPSTTKPPPVAGQHFTGRALDRAVEQRQRQRRLAVRHVGVGEVAQGDSGLGMTLAESIDADAQRSIERSDRFGEVSGVHESVAEMRRGIGHGQAVDAIACFGFCEGTASRCDRCRILKHGEQCQRGEPHGRYSATTARVQPGIPFAGGAKAASVTLSRWQSLSIA